MLNLKSFVCPIHYERWKKESIYVFIGGWKEKGCTHKCGMNSRYQIFNQSFLNIEAFQKSRKAGRKDIVELMIVMNSNHTDKCILEKQIQQKQSTRDKKVAKEEKKRGGGEESVELNEGSWETDGD
jgi:hypothetical protein